MWRLHFERLHLEMVTSPPSLLGNILCFGLEPVYYSMISPALSVAESVFVLQQGRSHYSKRNQLLPRMFALFYTTILEDVTILYYHS